MAKAIERMKKSMSKSDRWATYTHSLFTKSTEYMVLEEWFKSKTGFSTLLMAKKQYIGKPNPPEFLQYPKRYSEAMKKFEKQMFTTNTDLEEAALKYLKEIEEQGSGALLAAKRLGLSNDELTELLKLRVELRATLKQGK